MKKTFRILSLLLLAVLMMPAVAKAQMPQLPNMGVDPDVRIGKLSNGLTYYIRHNEYPKGQADFYIAQKVGSILENDDQRGLAHFLEHMCFNGTTNFPGKNLINWLESVGVKFGQNLNAYTAVDQTVYNISNVPVARVGVQDSCLLILHDWANDLLLLDAEIDAERGVIHQEWRRSMVGQMRILENLLPTIYPGSPYGYRLPIGTMEVVDNFPYQALRDYYEKWYRPDQQGIIVVGDIDVDRIENKIKEMFSDIKMPVEVAERVYFPVPDTEGTIYAIGHDKEQTTNLAELMWKTDVMPDEQKGTMLYYVQDYITDMISQMLNTRLDEITSKPGAPFASAGVYYGNFFLAKTKDAFNLSVMGHNSDLPAAIAAAYREVLRASRGGFTLTEYERARNEYLSQAERSYNNRNQRENETYVNMYVNNFLDNDPIPTKEEEYETVKQIAAMIPVEAINQTLAQLVTSDNRVLLALLPDNAEGVYPTEEQFASALAAVDAETIEPYKEELKAEPLIPQLPTPGKIVKETKLAQWGDAIQWELSNGATVIVKPTKFKDDEVLFSATALNGTAPYGADYANSLTFMGVALRSCGLGTYTNSDLSKYLSGKQVSINPSFGLYSRTISGSSTPKDIPTLMELIYMGFTDINFSEDEFAALQSQYASAIHNQEANPQYIFQKKIYESLYNSPRMKMLDVDVINGAQRAQIVEVAHAMTANAADFTFTFVGNVDVETLRPLVEQYIASLPGDAKTAHKKIDSFDPQFDMIGGKKVDSYTAKMETPQTWVYITTFGNEPFDTKNSQLASVAGQILSKRLLDIVREDMGAVYSIGASGSMERIGDQNTEVLSAFPMKPEMKDQVLKVIEEQFAGVGKEVKPEELDKVKEFMVKNYTEMKEKNSGWNNAINGWLRNGVDTFNPAIETINAITTADVQNFMQNLLNQGNYRVIVLDPTEIPAAE